MVMFTGINHIAVVVRNLEEALRFYHGTLGLALGKQATVADQGVKAALLPVGEDEIELLEPTNPAGGVAKFLEKKGEGVHHLCVETSDIARAIAQAKSLNLQLIDQNPRQGLAGTIGFLHPAACQGILVEMAQPAEGEAHAAQGSNGIRAQRVATIFAAVKDRGAAAEAFVRNFGGRLKGESPDPCLGVPRSEVEVGSSRLTLYGGADLSASPVGERILAGRGDGVFGICLKVGDLEAARRHLAEKCVSAETLKGGETSMIWLPAAQANGVNLFLSA
jgi:methylmalonyl-CoA epimerase